jgi:hypothetical protein
MARNATSDIEAQPLPYVPVQEGKPIDIAAMIEAEVKKRIDAIEEEKREKAAAVAEQEKKAITDEAIKALAEARRPVKIKLFKDGGKYKEALYVNINDYNAVIPRGVEVTVPYYVAKHIEESQAQDESTAAMITELVEEWNKKEQLINKTG